jgi:hypothetical protein
VLKFIISNATAEPFSTTTIIDYHFNEIEKPTPEAHLTKLKQRCGRAGKR